MSHLTQVAAAAAAAAAASSSSRLLLRVVEFDTMANSRAGGFKMSNLSEASKEAGSAGDSSVVQKAGAWSSTLSILLQQASVYGVAAGYCLSASLLSIINKWAVMKFPYPGALTALQYFTSVAGVLLCGQLKLIKHDGLNLKTMWKFLPASVMFYISIFTNSELLLHANVDTFIVFRSAVPIFVAIGETLYLHQPWPSLKTWLSLSTILGGSLIYVFTDNQFTVTAYTWAVAYLASMSIDFVYIKHVVMTIGLNTWGLVLYNNLEALMLYPLEMLLMGELNQMKVDSSNATNWLSFDVILPVALSCLFGLSISFFGFSCRRAISATGFTVLGIVNKLLTVVINLLIWDKHASFVGTIGLLICMSGGVLYQQSTTKPKAPNVEPKEESDEEQQKLMEMQQGHESNSTQKQASS
uniref:Sugar phosphate transporter domain-containing protein n=1 Tax=Leersia perrieri TaxID=77586 RepID=A0A0D9WET8_9ORYZ